MFSFYPASFSAVVQGSSGAVQGCSAAVQVFFCCRPGMLICHPGLLSYRTGLFVSCLHGWVRVGYKQFWTGAGRHINIPKRQRKNSGRHVNNHSMDGSWVTLDGSWATLESKWKTSWTATEQLAGSNFFLPEHFFFNSFFICKKRHRIIFVLPLVYFFLQLMNSLKHTFAGYKLQNLHL